MWRAGSAEQAEAMGVEIYPGFAAAELLYSTIMAQCAAWLRAIWAFRKRARKKTAGHRAWKYMAKYTLLGRRRARVAIESGDCPNSSWIKIATYQKFGIGIKELWQVDPAKHKPGYVQHTLGWPLDNQTGGGSWMYHFGDNYRLYRFCHSSELSKPAFVAL